MDRIVQLPAVCLATGIVAGALLSTTAQGAPWLITILVAGLLAAVTHHARYGHHSLVNASTGFLLAVLAGTVGDISQATPLEHAVYEGPVDLLLSAVVDDGPRAAGEGYTYGVRVLSTDDDPDGATVRLWLAGEDPAVWPGDQVEVFARCRPFSPPDFPHQAPATFWESRSFSATCRAVEPPSLVGRSPTPARWLSRRRHRLEERLLDILGRRAGVPTAMLTGTRSRITHSEREAHRRAGTAHLLAISGLHFGALAALVWAVVGWLVRRSSILVGRFGARRPTALFVIAVMLAYVIFVGAPISALRAFVAAGALGLAVICQRTPSGLAAVALAATGVLLIWPGQVHQLGFQLSFVATAAIVSFWHRPPTWLRPDALDLEPSRWKRRLRATAGFVTMSWYATAATAPLIMGAFGQLSIVAFLTNVVAVPIVTLIIFPALLVGAGTVDALPEVGERLIWWSTDAMLHLTIAMEHVAELPGGVWTPGAPPRWLVWGLVALVFCCLVARSRLRVVVATSAIGATALLGWANWPDAPHWRVHFIPVGQGDAVLIETPGGEHLLVDAGGSRWGRDPGRSVVVPYLRRIGLERLDGLIVSHADMDHAGGVPAVLEDVDVARLVTGPDSLAVPGVALERWAETGSRNDRSIVVRIEAGPTSVVLTGDVEAAAELSHLPSAKRTTVVKIPHHGSKTSSTAAWLDATRPSVAVVSAGRHNTFGHPHPDVVARYRARGIALASTAENGLVVVEFDADGRLRVKATRWRQ